MKGLIDFFIRRPVTVIMILTAQIIAAVFSVFSLPVNRLPDFPVPRVTVETLYPGMAANEIRSFVTIPLEDGLSPVKGLEKMRSVSRDNSSLISLDFRWGTDPMAAGVIVREAIDAVYPGLPEGVKRPSVTSGNNGTEAHVVIAVSSRNGSGEFARKLAEYEIQARLRRIDGVGSVVLTGGEKREERIALDVHKLAALGLTPSDFSNLLSQETADIPAGNARQGNMELIVTSAGKPESISSLSKIILPAGSGAFRVEDAGEIFSSPSLRESIFVYNGKEAAGLEIFRRPGSDPLKLSRDIKKTIDEAALVFSRDAQIEIVKDASYSLLNDINELLISAVFAAAAVIAVFFLFIRSLKCSLLVALSIPVSIAMGICVLFISGKSINSMSLSGLIMGISLVSDISVIVLDLLNRNFGKNNSSAVSDANLQHSFRYVDTNAQKVFTAPNPEEVGKKVYSIAGSSAASTLTTALVFVPILMLPGSLGSIFGDIAVALTASVAAGWFYAQFCLPSLYLLFFNFQSQFKNSKLILFNKIFLKKYAHIFSALIRSSKKIISLKNFQERKKSHGLSPFWIFTAAVVLSVTGFLTLALRPVVFVNPDEAEEIWVSVVFSPGTLLEAFSDFSSRVSGIILELPSVKTVYGRAGAEEEDVDRRADIDYRREELILRCALEKGVKPENALAEINSILKRKIDMPFSAYFPKDRLETLLGLSASRTFVIKGKDREELLERFKIAKSFFDSESADVNFRPQGLRPELRLYPNREAAAYLSISASQIAQTLYILNKGAVVTSLEIDGRPLDVRVTGRQAADTGSFAVNAPRNNFILKDVISQLEEIPLKTGNSKTVYLGSLGRIERQEAQASLARLDRSDVLYADVASGNVNSSIINKFSAQHLWFTGIDESIFSRYRNSVFLYVFLVLIMLYMAMGAQFESFLLPLILMMSIPFSLAGAGPALLISGSKIDSGAVLGLTALFGLVVNNSLLLFEISDEKIRAGLSPSAAVFRGACERFQAILITMTTSIFALLPLILSPLGNSQKSMAVAMLGGLTASTLISLFVIPLVLIRYFKWKLADKKAADAICAANADFTLKTVEAPE